MFSTLRASLRRPRTPLSSAKLLALVVLIAALCSCEKSGHEHLVDARSSLASASYDDAVSAAQAGLVASPSKPDAWGLELVKLEAHARAGNGEDAKQQISQLARLHPDRIPASEYFATAHQLKMAGKGTEAIEVLDLGMRRFPDNEVLNAMIGASSESADVSSAELEMLKSLGYL